MHRACARGGQRRALSRGCATFEEGEFGNTSEVPFDAGLRFKGHSRRVVTSSNETRTKLHRKSALPRSIVAQTKSSKRFTSVPNGVEQPDSLHRPVLAG